MIRPRAGDFLYSKLEEDVMKTDIEELRLAGADGFVFGALNRLLFANVIYIALRSLHWNMNFVGLCQQFDCLYLIVYI